MKSEHEIIDEITKLKGDIQRNLKEYNNELERKHPLSAKIHWEYHQTLLGWRNALEWTLKDEVKEKDKK